MRDRPDFRPPRRLALFLVLAVALLTIGALRQSSDYFTETAILQSSDSTFVHMKGDCECKILGTFGGASADVETEIQGTGGVIRDVDVAALISVVAETAWVSIRLGSGGYRIEVTGGDGTTSLTFHCRRVTP